MIMAKSYENTVKPHENSMYGVDCMICNIDIPFKDTEVVSTDYTPNDMNAVDIKTLKNISFAKYYCVDQYVNVINDWEPCGNLAKGV